MLQALQGHIGLLGDRGKQRGLWDRPYGKKQVTMSLFPMGVQDWLVCIILQAFGEGNPIKVRMRGSTGNWVVGISDESRSSVRLRDVKAAHGISGLTIH